MKSCKTNQPPLSLCVIKTFHSWALRFPRPSSPFFGSFWFSSLSFADVFPATTATTHKWSEKRFYQFTSDERFSLTNQCRLFTLWHFKRQKQTSPALYNLSFSPQLCTPFQPPLRRPCKISWSKICWDQKPRGVASQRCQRCGATNAYKVMTLVNKRQICFKLPWYIEFLAWKQNTHQNIRSNRRKCGRYSGNTVAPNWLRPVRHPCYVWIRVWTERKDLSKYLVVFVFLLSYLDFTDQYCRYCIFKDIAKFVCLRNKGFMATVS